MQAKYVLTCVLFSYSEQLASTASCFREEESKQLIQLLESYSSMFLASNPTSYSLKPCYI